MPLWLDLGDLRVIHAFWDKQEIAEILKYQDGEHYLSEKHLRESCRNGIWQFRAVETILKGKEIPLKPGASFKDKDGNVRHNIRVRWCDREATCYKDAIMGPESARTHILDDLIEGDHMLEYSHEAHRSFLVITGWRASQYPLSRISLVSITAWRNPEVSWWLIDGMGSKY